MQSMKHALAAVMEESYHNDERLLHCPKRGFYNAARRGFNVVKESLKRALTACLEETLIHCFRKP